MNAAASVIETAHAIDDGQLDRLETLLDDPALEDAMRLDEMQGFLCAALAGPATLPDPELIEEMLGDTKAVAEVRSLLVLLLEAVRRQMASGELVLWLYPVSSEADAAMDYGPWCMAYLHGVDFAGEDWFDRLDEAEAEYLDERLYPMMVLTGEAEAAAREHGDAWPAAEELAEMVAECEETLPDVVAEIHRFWVVKRGAGTVRREAPKVGRNDLCPCGSGRKYKQCCGLDAGGALPAPGG